MPIPFIEFGQDLDANTNWFYMVNPSHYNTNNGGDVDIWLL